MSDSRKPGPVSGDPGRRTAFLALLAALIGVTGGYAAWGLYGLIALVTNLVFFQRVGYDLPSLQHHALGAWVILVPAAGGLVVSLMAHFGSSRIRGHGIPEAMEAVLLNQSRIAPRVAILKPLSAAVSIGTGGPFGAEGPIIQTGGAIGSAVGQLLHVTAAERRVLLACGAAAGMAGVFSTPIAAVILAIELLLFEFRSRSFIPLVIASTIATTVHYALFGGGPLFEVARADFAIPRALPFWVLLGLLAGLAAAGLSRALYWIEDQYERLPVGVLWWPVIGGLALGVIGWIAPRVLGVGYDTIGDILNGRLALAALGGILLWKSLALLLSLGSGTSGGLLAPTLMLGAALGGAFAGIADRLFPSLHLDPAAFALVGMAAVFGSAARASFAFIVFAFELTRDYDAVLPLMLAVVIASAVAQRLMKESIMTEKLARRGVRVHAEYEVDVLKLAHVRDVMSAVPDEPLGDATLTCRADDSVHTALELMIAADVDRLRVVDVQDPGRTVGCLTRDDVVSAYAKRHQEERKRQTGWVARMGVRNRASRPAAPRGD